MWLEICKVHSMPFNNARNNSKWRYTVLSAGGGVVMVVVVVVMVFLSPLSGGSYL